MTDSIPRSADRHRQRRGGSNTRVVLAVLCVPVSITAILFAAGALGDGSRLSNELSSSARETTVLVCGGGRIVQDGDSLLDRIFGGNGSFRCTDWRVRGTGAAAAQTPPRAAWPSSPKR